MNNEKDIKKFHGLNLLQHCGSGAYGDVYYCEDISGRKMAVKIISKSKLGDAWERELRGVVNYRRITENASGLLQIYHVEEDDEMFFYTMEAADSVSSDGQYRADTLAERLKKEPLPKTELYPTLSAIFAGIRIIHDAGFAHRDIKPDNIIFVKGQPKLSDIGLLSSLSGTYTQLAGTLDFLPPEERASDNPSTDRRSRQKNDLYAFGKVIYCSVTGCSPQDFPTVPAELPLTPELKFFLRLAFRLCNKDPLLRLNSLEKTADELAQIERKLQYGETFRDKCQYVLHGLLSQVSAQILSLARWSKRHWLFILIALLVISPLILYLKPEKKFDITKVKSKKYVYSDKKLSMTIPAHWIVVSHNTFKKLLKELAASKELRKRLTEEQLKLMISALPPSAEMIFCGNENSIGSSITVSVFRPENGTMKELEQAFREAPEDELKLEMVNVLTGEYQLPIKIFSTKKGQTAGHFSLELFYEVPNLGKVARRSVLLNDRMYTIDFASVSLKKAVEGDPREKFHAVVSTLEIKD